MTAQLIIPDVTIARLALDAWDAPYRAQVMTTIALCENGGDTYSYYLNTTGLFAGYADRGLWAINEAVVHELTGAWPDPATFIDPSESVKYAHMIWEWRFNGAINRGATYTAALVYAYEGWTTYKQRFTKYAQVWPDLFARASRAVQEASRSAGAP